ncbi:TetR/AcrR family transcriptional regulator [Acuticoccus sp. I52.16.1]|uniref:acrylate utilization transcriptional regulator AcuR n=1 Tax=Acuticoccus sp. I52.16.1 TaxID=2928472 RepID=UPI001FD03249|nr:TetR/AcrR family transcriptional regulator [Acuticoccus sp. I52.16.1]UOM35030.1 TetR/AcrR family transcriptional regulator [Acuticoccus sp. I52.16.1]
MSDGPGDGGGPAACAPSGARPAETSGGAAPPARRRGRPPRDAARLEEARDRLLRAGVAMLTERGFGAVGLEEVLGTVGVPKGSFYHYFGSKSEFGLALIDSYAAYFAAKLDRWFLDESRAPLDRLRAFVADARAGMERFGFARGCLVGNLGQEIGALPEPFRARLSAVFADWESRTARCLEAARAAGEIAPEADCRHLARAFWIGWEGAVLRAKLERSAAPLDLYAETFFALLAAGRAAADQPS